MKQQRHHRSLVHLLMTAAVFLIIISIIMLVRAFNQYNALSLERQDSQMENMVLATDAMMGSDLSNFRAELCYVIERRGFLNAENTWHETGNPAELLTRMQENLVTGNPMIHNMLAIQGDEIVLASDSSPVYYFPDGVEGTLQPCFTGDGAMYLALIENGQHARYAILLSMDDWYAVLAQAYANENTRLMLLGSQKRILLHTWQEQQRADIMDDLTESNCDIQAVRYMLENHASMQQLTVSYALSYPGDDYVHEMRMTALPVEAGSNGYFVVGLTSDYDEIILPMQATAWKLMLSGALLVSGAALMMLMIVHLGRQNRYRDRELERLILRNAETQKLLDTTTELAHHQRLETIGTLTSSIAHEFNNLLTPIMGYSILTLEKLPEECGDLADNITEIYEASRKAKDIISRLNALSRKHEAAALQRLSLSSIMRKALQVAAPAQPPKVTTHLADETSTCFISGNETQLSQLMLNLILNAYHAMETTGGALTLTLCTEEDCAVVQVQDEGIGIPPEAISSIFDPFFTTKESGRGTGLGLAIVQQVAENHHGTITVESAPGQGSIFTLRLPLASDENAADAAIS